MNGPPAVAPAASAMQAPPPTSNQRSLFSQTVSSNNAMQSQSTSREFSKSVSSHQRPVSYYQQNGASNNSGSRTIHPPPPPVTDRHARPHSTAAIVGATAAASSNSTSGASSTYQSSSTSPESTWARSHALSVAAAAPTRASATTQPQPQAPTHYFAGPSNPMGPGAQQPNRLSSAGGSFAGADQNRGQPSMGPFSPHNGSYTQQMAKSNSTSYSMSQAERSLQHLELMKAVMQSTPERSSSSTQRSSHVVSNSSTQQTSVQMRAAVAAGEVRRGIVGRMAAVLANHAPPPDESADVWTICWIMCVCVRRELQSSFI